MWLLRALLGLVGALAACAPSEPPRAARNAPSAERCATYEEARRLLAVDPAAARESLEIALTGELPGRACRARMAALLGALATRSRGLAEAGELELDSHFSAAPRIASETEERDAPDPRPRPTIVVLDPGHGGNEYGATSGDVRESRLTLDIARRAAEVIRARQPEIEVRLTRDADRRVSLEQRAAMANAVGASAFISIHLNDAEGDVRRGGVTTFVLDTTDDEQAIRLAARENGTSVDEVSSLSLVLAGLERQAQLGASRVLADRVHAETLRGARRELPRISDRGIRSAAFRVLVGARMPAVLLEASFMNIPGEREALRTERYRQRLAEGIAQGILRFVFEEA